MTNHDEKAPRNLRILVVEDDPRIAAQIVAGLKRESFDVELVQTGEIAIEKCTSVSFDMILLDLGLPGIDGFSVMDSLRHRCRSQILVLTAQQDLEARVRSFRSGAVDWMSKPFFMEELIERIRLRLNQKNEGNARTLSAGKLCLDLDTRKVTIGDRVVALSTVEFNILAYLMDRDGRPISRQQLMDHVLPQDMRHTERAVDSHIAHIRQKLGDVGAAIRTVWGIGYRFESLRS